METDTPNKKSRKTKAWIIAGSALVMLALIAGLLYAKWLYDVPAVAIELAELQDGDNPEQSTIKSFEGLLGAYLRTTRASPRKVATLTIKAKAYYDNVDPEDRVGQEEGLTLGRVCQLMYDMVPPDSFFTVEERQEMFLGVFAGKESDQLETFKVP